MNEIEQMLGIVTPVRLDDSEECIGCGNEKRHRGRPASSLVCCNECWKRLPKWAKEAFSMDDRRPVGGPDAGATIWQHRLSILLQWMNEAERIG